MNRNNEQKNTYVKKQITLALLELLKEKPLVDISISELTQKAQIGRVSFYRNYQTKEDILREESDRLLKEWGKLYEENPAWVTPKFCVKSIERRNRAKFICRRQRLDRLPPISTT